MSVRFANSSDQSQWDQFVLNSPHGSFLQSWAWGEMQRELGVPFWRLVEEEQGKINAVALVIRRALPMGRSWLYVPRGPIFTSSNPHPNPLPMQGEGNVKRQHLSLSKERSADRPGEVPFELQNQLVDLAHQQKAIFIRIDPSIITSPFEGEVARRAGEVWRKSDREVQPKQTIILDLTKSNEELLAAMHSKTRYNINIARKKGVTVRWATDAAAVDIFWQLAQDVSARGDFRYHPKSYYEAMVKILGAVGMLQIGIAEHDGHALAAHIMITAGRTTTYTHGASSSRQRQLMAPYLLHWEAIQRARHSGATGYDLFGVGPQWPGITRFKEGFGGQKIEYIGAHDLVIDQSLYSMFNLMRKIRAIV